MSHAKADPADLSLALSLAEDADRITMSAFRRSDLRVDTKPDLTPVTDADRNVELALRDRLGEERPADSVVGEEFGAGGDTGERGLVPLGRRWIIDPIDGTKNFVRRIPVWATLIALEVHGDMGVGVVSAPALGRRWWAGRGLGAFAGAASASRHGDPIRVSGVSRLEDAQMSGASISGWDERGGPAKVIELSKRCWRDRGFGDFWSHMLVAEGSCEIGLDPVVSIWDLAALQVIVEEAGGRFSDLSGVATVEGGSAISSNGLLHEAALEIVGDSGA